MTYTAANLKIYKELIKQYRRGTLTKPNENPLKLDRSCT